MSTWDVIVFGLGGVGSAAAYHLSRQGHRVLGIDQFSPGHDKGSSHGRTRIIRQAYFEDPAYVPLLQRAYELWKELENETGQHLFHRTGIVEMGPMDGVVIPGIIESATQHKLDIEQLSAKDVESRWPGIRAEDDWAAVVENNAGYLCVEDCVLAHLDLARKHGAKLRHNEKIVDWKFSGSSIEVRTDSGSEQGAHLVIAAGPWSPSAVTTLSANLKVLRKHQYWFETPEHDLREDNGYPCFFHETENGYFYGFPSSGESGVKVARHSGGTELQTPSDDSEIDPHDLQMVQHYIRAYLPGLQSRMIKHAGCYYTNTPDEHFVIDYLPGHSNVTVITGLSGHGFKFTTVLGELASQLATNQASELDRELFRATRF